MFSSGCNCHRGWCTCTGLSCTFFFFDWFVYLHTVWANFVTIIWIYELNECQICLSMTKSGTCKELQALWLIRVMPEWLTAVVDSPWVLNAQLKVKSCLIFFMKMRGGLLYVLVSVWKTFFRYLLYVSVSNHGLLMSMQWWSYHAAIRGDYKKLHLLRCQKSHFGSFSFLNHSTQRRVVCYLNSSSSQK